MRPQKLTAPFLLRARVTRALLSIGTILFLIGVGACSRTPKESESLLDAPILKSLPADAFGFQVWNSERAPSKLLDKGPWNEINSPLLAASVLPDGLGRLVEETKLFDPDSVREAVLFVAGRENQLRWGAYLIGAPGAKLNMALAPLAAGLAQRGFSVDQSVDGAGFFLNHPALEGQARVAVLATESRLAISSEEQLARSFIGQQSGQPAAALPELFSRPVFTRAAASLRDPSASSIGFLDLDPLLAQARAAAREGQKAALGADIPFNALSVIRIPQQSLLRDQVGLWYRDGAAQTPAWTSKIKGEATALLTKVSANSVFGFSIDGEVYRSWTAELFAKLPESERAAAEKRLSSLKELLAVGLFVRSATVSAPFPEISAVVTSTQSAQVVEAIKTGLGESLQQVSGGMGWQSREISGTQAHYLLSPFGAGVFLAALDSAALIASTEQALSEALAASKGQSPSLLASLSSELRQPLEKPTVVATAYLNPVEVAALVKTVAGNLAMFTGGAASSHDEALALMRKFGPVSCAVAVEQGQIAVTLTHAPPVSK